MSIFPVILRYSDALKIAAGRILTMRAVHSVLNKFGALRALRASKAAFPNVKLCAFQALE
jgi:hypothetical protein